MSKELNIDLGQTGLTVTASVYLASVLKASGIACAEVGVTGKYSGDFTASPNVAGVYQVAFFSGGASVSCGGATIGWDGAQEVVPRVTLVDTTTTLTNAPSVPSAAVIADAVWDEAIAGHVAAGSTGAKLNSASSGSAAGAGAITWPYTLTNSVTGLPIADADVWVTSDVGGANVLASGRTNASGVVTFYLDAAAAVYVWRQKSGFNFTNPQALGVS